jgi:hypothetical protein
MPIYGLTRPTDADTPLAVVAGETSGLAAESAPGAGSMADAMAVFGHYGLGGDVDGFNGRAGHPETGHRVLM